MSRARDLSSEERILWDMVARTTTPLKGRRFAAESKLSPMAEPDPSPRQTAPVQAGASVVQPAPRQQIHHLDRTTQKKIARGRLPIEAKLDLHGLRQDEAHGLLLSFLGRAHGRGLRYVLVITGKGSSAAGEGVLKRSVPAWFATPAFRALVSGYEEAARGHGGGGALYVRLRREALR